MLHYFQPRALSLPATTTSICVIAEAPTALAPALAHKRKRQCHHPTSCLHCSFSPTLNNHHQTPRSLAPQLLATLIFMSPTTQCHAMIQPPLPPTTTAPPPK